MKDKLTEWLKIEQQNLEKTIANAAIKYYTDRKTDANFQYDLKEN